MPQNFETISMEFIEAFRLLKLAWQQECNNWDSTKALDISNNLLQPLGSSCKKLDFQCDEMKRMLNKLYTYDLISRP